jgi:hypothetical protein
MAITLPKSRYLYPGGAALAIIKRLARRSDAKTALEYRPSRSTSKAPIMSPCIGC